VDVPPYLKEASMPTAIGTVNPIPIPGSVIVEALGNAVDDLRSLPSIGQRELAIGAIVALLCAVDGDEVHVLPVDGLEGLYVLEAIPWSPEVA